MNSSRGVVMFAHNNSEIDYFKIACANALMVKKHLKVPVTLITDSGTLGWAKKSMSNKVLKSMFEHIELVDRDWNFNNLRNFSDTYSTTKSLQFYNCNHWQAYELSPYNETLVIDADYLIMSDQLSRCWGSKYDFMIDDRIIGTEDTSPYTKLVDDFGITLYWATVIYFKKTPLSENIFQMVSHIQSNYKYYQDLYCFKSGMFRNDNAFSIAVHTLKGFSKEESDDIGRLPIVGLNMIWDTADVYSVPAADEIVVLTEKSKESGTFSLIKLKNTDVHIMNKWAINRHSDTLIDLYKD